MERPGPDLYRILQVDPLANQLVIQAAYRVLAQIFHPDVSGDEAEMKRLNAAWEVLGDPRRRRQYDIERAGRHAGAAMQATPTGHPREQPVAGNDDARRATHSEATVIRTAGSPDAEGPTADAPTGPAARPEDHAGPPPGRPFGAVMRFGRYDGWSLGEIATVDRTYLEWLRNAPAGRALRDNIDAVLATRKGPGAVDQRRHYETNQQQASVHAWRPGAPTKVG